MCDSVTIDRLCTVQHVYTLICHTLCLVAILLCVVTVAWTEHSTVLMIFPIVRVVSHNRLPVAKIKGQLP